MHTCRPRANLKCYFLGTFFFLRQVFSLPWNLSGRLGWLILWSPRNRPLSSAPLQGLKQTPAQRPSFSHVFWVSNFSPYACGVSTLPRECLPDAVTRFSRLHLNLETEESTGAQAAAGQFTCARSEEVRESLSVSSSGSIRCYERTVGSLITCSETEWSRECPVP